MTADPGTSNHQKYTEGTRNPVVRYLMERLFSRVRAQLAGSDGPLLDAGCGEGHALLALDTTLPDQVVGFDVNPAAVDYCRELYAAGTFSVEDIYDLPYEAGQFQTVLCMEVLEHLDAPERALTELTRVCGGRLVLTVPFEPWFQLGNLARGNHLAGWGNHPEHVQHWNRRTFGAFLGKQPQLEQIRVGHAWPWLVASAQVRR